MRHTCTCSLADRTCILPVVRVNNHRFTSSAPLPTRRLESECRRTERLLSNRSSWRPTSQFVGHGRLNTDRSTGGLFPASATGWHGRLNSDRVILSAFRLTVTGTGTRAPPPSVHGRGNSCPLYFSGFQFLVYGANAPPPRGAPPPLRVVRGLVRFLPA